MPHLLTLPTDSFCTRLVTVCCFHCQSLPTYMHMIFFFFCFRQLGHIMMIEFSVATSSPQFTITAMKKLLCIWKKQKNIYIYMFNFHHILKIRQLRKSVHEWSGHTATVCCAQQLLAACTVLNVVPLTLYLWRQIDFASVYYPLNLCCVTCQFSCGDYCFEWLQVTYLLSKLHLIVRKIIFLIADFDAKYYLGADI